MKNDLLKTITRKFIDIINIKNWQVLSINNQFTDILTINKTVKYLEYQITSESGKKLKCADNHIIITSDDEEIFAKDCLGKYVITDSGIEKITNVVKTTKSKYMYDLELTDNHLYYTNGILSHNTTTYTIYALWLCMFHSEKKIMLLANKADTALEILSRIRMAYEYCPAFLKPGVFVWNKGEVVFANRSAIKGFATASDAARGYSANCVGKNVKINIRFKKFPFIKFHISIKYLRFFSKDYYYGLINNIIRKITMS